MPQQVAFWLGLTLANSILLFVALKGMMRIEHYQFLPIIFLAEGLFLFLRWDRVWRWPTDWFSKTLLSFGTLVTLATLLSPSPRLASLGFICFCGSWLLTHRDRDYPQSLITLWPPLWLLFRLPSEAETALVFGLQSGSTFFASYILDYLDITHFRQGNVIEVAAGRLFVEEACSGVQSVFTLLFCAMFLIPLFRRSIWLLPLYLVVGAVWAMVMNLARIVTIAYALDTYNVDLSKGWQHELLGYICLAFSMLFLLATDRLLAVLFFPTPPTNVPFGGTNPLNLLWNTLFLTPSPISEEEGSSVQTRPAKPAKVSGWSTYLSGAAVGLLAVSLIGQGWQVANAGNNRTASSLESQWQPPPDLFRNTIPGLVVVGYRRETGSIDMPFGQISDVWDCRYNEVPCQIAFSQPYPEWHDLRICYRASAWKLVDSGILSSTSTTDWSAIKSEFSNNKPNFAYVYFSSLNLNSGTTIAAPTPGTFAAIYRLFERNIASQLNAETEKVAMIQLLVTTDGKMTPTLQEAFEQLHVQTRDILKNSYKPPVGN